MSQQIHQKEFKRVETKYLVPREKVSQLLATLARHMAADDFAKSTISSLYFDTENFEMIQDSMAKKYGKEKIRLRTYASNPSLMASSFLEIKQKIDGVGYKYRVKTSAKTAAALVEGTLDFASGDSRLKHELDLLHQRYGAIKPRMLICYNRQSFKGKMDQAVRVTLDSDVTYNVVDQLTLTKTEETFLLPDHQLIMEIKVADKMPSWLEEIIASYQLEKTSFSKYGRAYQLHHQLRTEKEKVYA